jgi:hypothetical protein
MTTNVRTFLREFKKAKACAKRGEMVRVLDKDQEFFFTAAKSKKKGPPLGYARGMATIHGDLTKPTLPDSFWKPSLPE